MQISVPETSISVLLRIIGVICIHQMAKNVLDLLLHYGREELMSLTSSFPYSSAIAVSHTGTSVARQRQHGEENKMREGWSIYTYNIPLLTTILIFIRVLSSSGR